MLTEPKFVTLSSVSTQLWNAPKNAIGVIRGYAHRLLCIARRITKTENGTPTIATKLAVIIIARKK